MIVSRFGPIVMVTEKTESSIVLELRHSHDKRSDVPFTELRGLALSNTSRVFTSLARYIDFAESIEDSLNLSTDNHL